MMLILFQNNHCSIFNLIIDTIVISGDFKMVHSTISNKGFTLVEISIVLVIIGLLIGGLLGGVKLMDNMNTQKTIQEIKVTESAISTFRDNYSSIPGDMRNPNTRLSNCTDAPCSTSGNGNRVMEPANFNGAITNSSEVYTAWHHLEAAELIEMNLRNTLTTTFGRGQPKSPIGGGYRILNAGSNMPWGFCTDNFIQNLGIWIGVNQPVNLLDGTSSSAPCSQLNTIDIKIDDGFPHMGEFVSGWGCDPVTCTGPYQNSNVRGVAVYDFKNF